MFGVFIQGALSIRTSEITCDGVAEAGGSAPTYARPPGSMHACRRASNSSSPLDPREAVSKRQRHITKPVRVAAVQARLKASVSGSDLVGVELSLTQPEFPLHRTARKDYMRKAFYFPPECLIRSYPSRLTFHPSNHLPPRLRCYPLPTRSRNIPREVSGN